MYVFCKILLEIPFLEFKRIFRYQCSGGNCTGGEMGMRRCTWSYSRCEKQIARLRGEKLNNEEDMEVNGLTDGE